MNSKNYLSIQKKDIPSCDVQKLSSTPDYTNFFPVLRDTEVDHVEVLTDYTFQTLGKGRGK